MDERMREVGGPMDRTDALAEIQARLERCEDDLEWVVREAQQSTHRAASVSEEADEIERMLEELMTGGADQQGRGDPTPDEDQRPDADEKPDMDTLFREEEEEAALLIESEPSLRRATQSVGERPHPDGRTPHPDGRK